MYECQMKMIVPPGVGLLVAGLASGICYLLIGSFRRGKGEKSIDDGRCACCLKPFLVGRGVECDGCGARSCRKACCRWDSLDNAWFCLFCYHSRSWSRRKEKWFQNFGGLPVESEDCKDFRTAKSRVYDEGAEDVAIHSELDVAAGGCQERDSMETVREFVEKIVEGLVGNVDDTPIDRLYDHPAYKPATDTPSMAHTALRELVERAVDEARKLPGLGATVSDGLRDESTFSEQNYEDLLATAILNKVIEKFQIERVDDNSNVLHRRPRSTLANHESDIGVDEDASEEDSSGEESAPRARHIREPMSLTIEEQIEEVTTTYTSDEEVRASKTNVLDFRNARRVPFPEFGMDIVDPSQDSSEESPEEGDDSSHVDRITPVESWEENWLFQKKKIQTQSEPVAMLVPNPSSDFRALIGDKDAEDTSDLSEFSAQSDDEAEDEELAEAINGVIPNAGKADDDLPPASQRIDKTSEFSHRNGTCVKESASKETRPGIDVNRELEIIRPLSTDDKYPNKIFEPSEKLGANSSRSLKHSIDTAKHEIPKTSAMKTKSLCENTRDDCDVERLIAGLASTDETKSEPSTTQVSTISELGTEDRIERKNDRTVKEVKVDRRSQSHTMNGCLKDNSRDTNDDEAREVEGSGRSIGVTEKLLENSFKEKTELNGDENEVKAGGFIANDAFSKDTEGKCQTLAQARADSTKERPSLRIEVNENVGLATPPRPGTIAEREHKKWENAAPIENNPYSEENIQKRLLERQYARRSSDVSGNSTQLQTCESPPLQIVLGAGRPDFRRFGRDYYINEAKFPKGHSVEEIGFFAATSRPNSSLSQHSLSTVSDYEQQERSRSVDTESTCSTSSESRTKLTPELQHNNVQAALRRGSMPVGNECEMTETQARDSRNDERRQSLNDVSRDGCWIPRSSFDDILERERKNSKNEINAKLNNRGNFEESEKRIKRIDLKAYGFENEFNEKAGEGAVKSKRVVNKLDLRSFGYDSGLRRTQSNNNIDRRDSSRSNVRNLDGKSNLIRHNGRYSAHPSLASLEGSDDVALTKSSEALIDDRTIACETFANITSAKSVPNIGDLYSRVSDVDRKDEYRVVAIEDTHNTISSSVERDERNGSQETFRSTNSIEDSPRVNGEERGYVEKKLPMPSVKRLARAFDKTEPVNSVTARRPSKSTSIPSKERPTTPEIHIVDTPRQMHSLTARSLSREFREGLRQVTNKQAPPLRSNVIPEQNRSTDPRSPPNLVGSNEDVNVIAPGKLKNNIQFWEQLHRKS